MALIQGRRPKRREYQVYRLDKRFTGHHHFQFAVDLFTSDRAHRFAFTIPMDDKDIMLFQHVRKWCWEAWGPGIEVHMSALEPDALWGWHTSQFNESPVGKIFFKTENERAEFRLRFGI
jgi:hypothetical protein